MLLLLYMSWADLNDNKNAKQKKLTTSATAKQLITMNQFRVHRRRVGAAECGIYLVRERERERGWGVGWGNKLEKDCLGVVTFRSGGS